MSWRRVRCVDFQLDPDTNRAVTSAPSRNDPTLKIQNGLCYVTFAYDAARSIDLNKAEARVHEATQRSTLRHKRPAPSYFEYQPAPLRLTQDTEAIKLSAAFARARASTSSSTISALSR